MFRCPYCSAPGLVKQTRGEANHVRRRYHCSACKRRFSTAEYAIDDRIKTPAGEMPKPFASEPAPA